MSGNRLSEILSPATLARIDNYQILAKVVVEGFIAGMHRSVYHGFGSEFLQYRDYTSGDDLKYVDWKVFARRDRLYTKVFEEETNMNCTVVLDASASMGYQGERAACSKFHYGAMVAACLVYLASRQGDNIGLHCYSDTLRCGIPAGHRGGQLHRILAELQRVQPAGQSRHAAFLPYVAESLRRRGVVVFISDFLEAEDSIAPLLKRFRYAGNECIVVHVLDPDEQDLPFQTTTRFVDSESAAQIVTSPATVRAEYVAAMQAFQQGLRQLCLDMQSDYLACSTAADIGATLAAYLHRRGSVY